MKELLVIYEAGGQKLNAPLHCWIEKRESGEYPYCIFCVEYPSLVIVGKTRDDALHSLDESLAFHMHLASVAITAGDIPNIIETKNAYDLFCPIIKADCKGEDCAMWMYKGDYWSYGRCGLVNFQPVFPTTWACSDSGE